MSQTIKMINPVTGEIIDQQQIAQQLLAQAKEQGVSLVGPGGLFGGLTKTVLKTALQAEMTEHGYAAPQKGSVVCRAAIDRGEGEESCWSSPSASAGGCQ